MDRKIEMKNLLKLMERINAAELAMQTELRKHYPENSKILVIHHANQKTPSVMTIMGYRKGGYVRAWMPSRRTWNQRFVRDVFFADIIGKG